MDTSANERPNEQQPLHLDALPTELLLEIFQYLPAEANTYAGICLVNRHLRDIATPLLYHTIVSKTYGPAARNSGILVHRTLVQRPELAKHVKTIAWEYSSYDAEELHLLPAHAAASLFAREM